MSDPQIRSFHQFWPYYVRQHSHPATRTLHFLGLLAAFAVLAAGLVTGRWLLLAAALPLGYGTAWISQFFVEKNRPATFGHPLWALRGDFKMFGMILTRRMEREVRRVLTSG